MGRRIASQVHHQVSRLMRGNIIKEAPKWYQPVLDFPPLPLPAKAPPARTAYDQKMKPLGEKLHRPKNRPLPIHYIEDDIRRQFYSDHPFEAFRPTTLVEKGDIQLHEVHGESWTRLRQRGRNPNPEDAIQFTLNLHQQQNVPLSQAYARAVAQFRALRSEHHIATTFAVMEAEELGGTFVRGEIEHAFEKEKRAVATWESLEEVDDAELTARKRWKMIAQRHQGETNWSQGEQYVKLWQAGIRVNYSPPLTKSLDDLLEEDDEEDDDEDEDEDQLSEDSQRSTAMDDLEVDDTDMDGTDMDDMDEPAEDELAMATDEPSTDMDEATEDELADSEELSSSDFEDDPYILTKGALRRLLRNPVGSQEYEEEGAEDEEYVEEDEEYVEEDEEYMEEDDSEEGGETDADVDAEEVGVGLEHETHPEGSNSAGPTK